MFRRQSNRFNKLSTFFLLAIVVINLLAIPARKFFSVCLLSLLRQLELFGKHRFALLVLVSGPGFREGDAARAFLCQQLPHSLPRRDQKQKYDEALETVYQIRRYPGQGFVIRLTR